MKNFKQQRNIFNLVAAMTVLSATASTAADETYAPVVEKHPVGFYLNAGVFGDFALKGYDIPLVSRDERVGFQLEIGGAYFAIPVSFSSGQEVDIIGIKPRFQYLVPITESVLSAGPGIGFVYNYWKSDFGTSGANVSAEVHEFGAQPSLQIMIRPIPFLNVLITPAAFDFNFYRDAKVKTRLVNFSTSDEDLGIVYSAGASVGFSF